MTGGFRGPGVYFAIIVLGLVVLLQGTLFARIRFYGASPDLLLVVVLSWSLLSGVAGGLIWAFAGGLAVDLIAGMPLGASSLALMPIALLGGLGRGSVYAQNGFLPLLLVLVATPLHGLIMLAIQQVRGLPVDWPGSFLRVVLSAMVLNALLMIPTMRVLRWLASAAEPARVG